MDASSPPEADPLVAEILADPDGGRAQAEVDRLVETSPAEGAILLERLADAAAEPAERASRWLTDAARLWSGAAGDPKRAARALRAAVEACPGDARALELLVSLYRENGKHRALARILDRRAEAFEVRAREDGAGPDAARAAADAFALLGDVWRDPPLASPAEALAAYDRAIATGAASLEAIRAARALHLAAGQVAEALPLFAMERERGLGREAQVALYRQEAAARKLAGDAEGQTGALRLAFGVDPGATGLAEELAGAVVDRLEAGAELPPEERAELARILKKLEAAAVGDHDPAALRIVFTLSARAVSGPARAAELVRQAEVLVGLGAEPAAAVRHAETGLAVLAPVDASASLARLAALLGGDEAADLFERAAARAAPADRPQALEMAVREGSKRGSLPRLERLFGALLSGGVDASSISALEKAATDADHRRGGTTLRGYFAAALAGAEPATNDGGRAKSALLRRAALIARRDLDDPDQAFEWLGDALFARLEGALGPIEAHFLALAPPPRPPSSPALRAVTMGGDPPYPPARPDATTPSSLPRVVVFGPPPPNLPPIPAPPGLPNTAALGPLPPSPSPSPAPVATPPVARPPSVPAPPPAPAARPPSVSAPPPARPPSVPAPPPPSAARPPSVPAPPPRPAARPPSVPAPPPAVRPPSTPPPSSSAPRLSPVPHPASRPPSVAPPTGGDRSSPPPPPAPPPPRMELADPFPAPSKDRASSPGLPVSPAPESGPRRAARQSRRIVRQSAPSDPSIPPASESASKLRVTGEELIADLFEAMHALDFCKDSVEAAAFTLKLAMEKLASDTGAVHLYDIDRREFVVVQAEGPGASALRGLRTGDADPLAAEAMRTRGAFVVAPAAGDPRASGQRWEALAAAAGRPVGSIACARAAQAGRFLGLVELANLGETAAFQSGDEHALTYISERFTEFVAAHGVLLGDEG